MTDAQPPRPDHRIRISLATNGEREAIYAMRHAIYAAELGQHPQNLEGRLSDDLDSFNHYLVAAVAGQLVGFVSVTPPGFGRYSIDKYVERSELPFPIDDALFEVRILTVDPRFRGTPVAALLMYAAFRWVEEHGGTTIVAIGRVEVASLYERVGMRRLGRSFRSGAVTYELMAGRMTELRDWLATFGGFPRRLLRAIDWNLTMPLDPRAGAFHGGASVDAIGVAGSARRRLHLIDADVLDAWFPPAPGVEKALVEDVGMLARTSPPTYAQELTAAIASARRIDPAAIALGAGLSDLIFRSLPRWLDQSSRALLVEPQYSEYRHVLESVIGCRVDRLHFDPGLELNPDPSQLVDYLSRDYDLLVLVNPNNPLGYQLTAEGLDAVLSRAPGQTMIWVDETYVDFTGLDRSLERIAAASENLIVGKSMSKAYALSGLRVGYLCGPPRLMSRVWQVTPPWAVSRPAQVAAIAALADPGYYTERYRETAELRAEIVASLSQIPGLRPRPGVANFVLCDLAEDAPDAATLAERTRERGLFIRTFPSDPALRWRAIRVAIKDRQTNEQVIRILGEVLAESVSRAAGTEQPVAGSA